jgi:hypothetical protein
MGLFGKKESPTDEFLHLYVTLGQYRGWLQGSIPQAFRQGISKAIMQQVLRVWATENNDQLAHLDSCREAVIAYRTTKSDLKKTIDQMRELIAQADARLSEKGRQS